MDAFDFPVQRHAHLGDSVSDNAKVIAQLNAVLQQEGQSELAAILVPFTEKEERICFDLPVADMAPAADLRESDPELLRRLRYAFRDWRNSVLTTLRNRSVGPVEETLVAAADKLLTAENVTLFASRAHGPFQWACCAGFQFNNHSDNFLSPLAGDYLAATPEQPEVLDSTDDPATSIPANPILPEPISMNEPTPPSPPDVLDPTMDIPWWRGKEHQAFLIFSCGFLFAAILSALILRFSACDISGLQRQIDNMQLQVNQRCNTPRP